MGYDNQARRAERKMLELMIKDDPIAFVIQVPVTGDLMKGNKLPPTNLGPFTGSLAQFRQSRSYPTYDEKGVNSHHGFILVALDVPDGSFAIDRIIIIEGRTYRVTSIPEVGEISEVNLDLVE